MRRIGDIFVRYLMQYEILLGQVTKKHTQKEVVEYIEKVYNPANKDRQIGFQPTRKLGRKYKEDDLTYNRNLLGHLHHRQKPCQKICRTPHPRRDGAGR